MVLNTTAAPEQNNQTCRTVRTNTQTSTADRSFISRLKRYRTNGKQGSHFYVRYYSESIWSSCYEEMMNYVWCNITEDTGVHYIYFKHPDTKSQMNTETNTSIAQNLLKRCGASKSTNTPFVLNVCWMCRRAAAVTQWKFYRLWFMVVHLTQFVTTEWIVGVNERGNKVSLWREE